MTGDSTHLADLKALTHDVLYETYRTEISSKQKHSIDRMNIEGKHAHASKFGRNWSGYFTLLMLYI